MRTMTKSKATHARYFKLGKNLERKGMDKR